MALSLFLASNTAQAAPGQIKRLPDQIPGIYIVVLNKQLPSPVSAIARGLTKESGGEVAFTTGLGMNSFVFRGPESAALAISRSALVSYVEEASESQTVSGGQYQPPWNLDRIDQRATTGDYWYIWGYTVRQLQRRGWCAKL